MSVNLSSGIGNNYNVEVPVAQQPKAPVQTATTSTQVTQTTLNPSDSNKINNLKTSSYDPASFKMPVQKEEPNNKNKTEAEPTRANGLVAAFAAFASMASGSYVPEIGNAIQKSTSDYLSLTNRFGGTVGINPFGGIKEPSNKKSDYQTFIDNNKALNEAEKVKN